VINALRTVRSATDEAKMAVTFLRPPPPARINPATWAIDGPEGVNIPYRATDISFAITLFSCRKSYRKRKKVGTFHDGTTGRK
jgi:hypothetical protein